MGKIAQYDNIDRAGKVLAEIDRQVASGVSAATTLRTVATQYFLLKAEAEDAADNAVFDAKFAKMKTDAKAAMSGATAQQKAAIQDFITFVLS